MTLAEAEATCSALPACKGITFRAAAETASGNISKVYIVFSNHLDVGYTDNNNGSCAGAVVNRYFHDHFPLAIETAKQFRAAGNSSAWRYQ